MTPTTKSPLFRKRDLAFIGVTVLVMAPIATVLAIHCQDLVSANLQGLSRLFTSGQGDTPPGSDRIEHEARPQETTPVKPVQVAAIKKPALERAEPEAEAQESQGTNDSTTPRRTQTPRQEPEAAQPSMVGSTVLLVVLVLALAVVSPITFAYCFFRLLQRHSERFGALIEINGPAAASVPALRAGPLARSGNAKGTHAETGAEPALAPKPEPAKKRPEALFDRLFEETLELQSQIDAIDDPNSASAK